MSLPVSGRSLVAMHRCAPSQNGNLQMSGQNARLRWGGLMLVVALVLSVALVQADVARWWRLSLFVPFAMAAFGAWQGLFRTCPGLVSKGMRESSCGMEEPIRRSDELDLSRRDARRVLQGTLVTALAATTVVCLIP